MKHSRLTLCRRILRTETRKRVFFPSQPKREKITIFRFHLWVFSSFVLAAIGIYVAKSCSFLRDSNCKITMMKYINKYNTVFHLVHHVHQLRRHRPPLLHPHKKPKGTTTTFELFKIISPLIISNFITEFHTCCWDSNILYNIFPLSVLSGPPLGAVGLSHGGII